MSFWFFSIWNLKVLGIDLKTVPKEKTPKIDAISLGLPNAGNRKMTQIERKIYTATTGNGLIPLDLIINVISGRLKLLKEEAKIISENNDVDYMFKNYRFIIQDYYNISKEDMYRFLHYCVSDPTYKKYHLKDEIQMIQFLKTMAIQFKKVTITEINPKTTEKKTKQ